MLYNTEFKAVSGSEFITTVVATEKPPNTECRNLSWVAKTFLQTYRNQSKGI